MDKVKKLIDLPSWLIYMILIIQFFFLILKIFFAFLFQSMHQVSYLIDVYCEL